MQTLKIEAAILLTLVNASHLRQLDLHIFHLPFSPLFRIFLSVRPSVLCDSLEFSGGFAVHVGREHFVSEKQEKSSLRRFQQLC